MMTKVIKNKQKRDRQCSYERNIEELVRNHGWHGKAVSATHLNCVSVPLVIQYVMRECHITSTYCYVWSGSTTFFHIFS